MARVVDAATAWTRPAARCRALCRRQRNHRPDHPGRLGGVAAHRRPERQRQHVRAQARRARDGPRWRRILRRHLVDRGEQHPPLVRCLRGGQVGTRPSDDAGRRRAGPVVGAGQLHPARPHPHRYGCADPRIRPRSARTIGRARRCRASARSPTSRTWRCSCSATPPSWITGQVINVDGGHGLRRGPDMSAMLEPVFGADGLRGVVQR